MTGLQDFKRQLAGYMSLHDLGDIGSVWRDLDQWGEVPGWCGGVLYIEEGQLGRVFNAWRDDWVEHQNAIECLMQTHDVWYEMQDCCVILLYVQEVMDAITAGNDQRSLFDGA